MWYQVVSGRVSPVDHHDDRRRDPDPDHHPARARLRSLRRLGESVAAHQERRCETGGHETEQQRDLLEETEDAEDLGDQDQHRDRDHDLGEARQRPHPGGREQGSQVVGA
jgi:hypothetical protein